MLTARSERPRLTTEVPWMISVLGRMARPWQKSRMSGTHVEVDEHGTTMAGVDEDGGAMAEQQ